MKKLYAAILFLLSIGFSNVSYSALITFEETGTRTGLFANEPPLTNQYSALGINFSGGWEILNQSGNFGINAHSGEHFAAYNTGAAGISNTLVMDFDQYLTDITGYLGDGDASRWTISAFNNNDLVSSSIVSNMAGSYVMFSLLDLKGLGVNRISILGSSAHAVLDDLNFNVSAVPLPAAAWLFGSALLGFVGVSRRRKATTTA